MISCMKHTYPENGVGDKHIIWTNMPRYPIIFLFSHIQQIILLLCWRQFHVINTPLTDLEPMICIRHELWKQDRNYFCGIISLMTHDVNGWLIKYMDDPWCKGIANYVRQWPITMWYIVWIWYCSTFSISFIYVYDIIYPCCIIDMRCFTTISKLRFL